MFSIMDVGKLTLCCLHLRGGIKKNSSKKCLGSWFYKFRTSCFKPNKILLNKSSCGSVKRLITSEIFVNN